MKKFFQVTVIEKLKRNVIIGADSWPEAFQIAENLCNDGIIDLNSSDFESRTIRELQEVTADKASKDGFYTDNGLAKALSVVDVYTKTTDAIYISGPITGVPDYMDKFEQAEKYLAEEYPGRLIINPAKMNATLPADTLYKGYMFVSLSLMTNCGTAYFLKGWQNSNGARYEHAYAEARNMHRIYQEN